MTTSQKHPFSPVSDEPRLGVDIDRVIIHGDGPDTSFIDGSNDDALNAPAMSGAFQALARLTERPEKAVICRKLGINGFVDDRADVLQAMRGIVSHLFLFGAHSAPDSAFTAVATWAEAERAIVAALAPVTTKTRETRAARVR